MLPKSYRLPLRTEWQRVKKNGKIIPGKLFSLIYCNGLGAVSRFAFIVSSKVHPRASCRNRAKRRLSEAVRQELGEVRPSFNGVFLAKKELLGADFNQISREVITTFKKAKIITANEKSNLTSH